MTGAQTVALQLPIRGLPAARVEQALDAMRAAQAGWTAEDRAALDAALMGRGASP